MNRANRPRLSRISGSSYASKLLGRAGDGSTLTLDFTTGVLDPRLTFTRASTGTFINSSGNVATASNNVARFDYDPTTLAPRGLLIEGTATNICTYSGDMTQSGAGHWTTRTNLDTSAWTGFTAPDGTATAVKLIPNTTNGLHNIQNVGGSLTLVAYTASAFVKADGRTVVGLAIGGSQAWQNFVLTGNGSLGSASTSPAPTSTITPVGSTGWYRVTMTWTSTLSAVGVQLYVTLPQTSSTSPFSAYAGDGTQNGVQAWGYQLELGSGSSYIPTGASTVQRLADFCTIPTSSFITGPLYPQTLFVDCIPANPSAAFPNIVRLFDRTAGGTFSYGTELYYYGSSTMTGQRKTNASTNSDRPLASGLAYNSRHKLAVAVDSSAFLGSYDGLTGSGATTAPPALASQVTHMGIGCTGDASAAAVMFGTIRQIKFFPFAMAQSQLNTLTTL